MDFFDQTKSYTNYFANANIDAVLSKYNPVEKPKISNSSNKGVNPKMSVRHFVQTI